MVSAAKLHSEWIRASRTDIPDTPSRSRNDPLSQRPINNLRDLSAEAHFNGVLIRFNPYRAPAAELAKRMRESGPNVSNKRSPWCTNDQVY